MSLITKNNYEAFLLDYVEGNLSPEHTAELMLFFENNPELKEDLEEFDLLTLDVPETSLENKEALKIDEDIITALTFDDFAIAEIEGLNSDKKSAAFAAFLKQNPTQQKEFEIYQKTKLTAPVVVFEDKPALKREQKVIPLYWWVTSAAAVILALFLLNGINWNDEKVMPIIANKIENSTIKEESINNVEAVIKDNLIAKETDVIEKVEEEKERNLQPKKHQPIIVKEKEPEVILANQTALDVIKDSVSNQTNNPQENIIDNEEILLASTDNVKIVYEEEAEDKSTTNSAQKKPTKFDAVRAVIKQQVRENFLNKVKDEAAVALNDGPFSFLKRKK